MNDGISDLACSGTQDSDIEGTAARQAVELEADLGKAKAPAFQPYLELSALLFVAFSDDDQVNTVPRRAFPSSVLPNK